MTTLTDYQSFEIFFSKNREGAEDVFAGEHESFVRSFDQVLNLGRTNFRSIREGTAVSLLLRAVKYLYTAHDLALRGHTEESRALLRGVTELEMIGYLVFKEEEVFTLWSECFKERMKHTAEGVVDTPRIQATKYQVTNIVKKHKGRLADNPATTSLLKRWGQFSTYYSHENLYNLVPRLDQGSSQTDLYVGTSFESANDRMQSNLQLTVDLLNETRMLLTEIIES